MNANPGAGVRKAWSALGACAFVTCAALLAHEAIAGNEPRLPHPMPDPAALCVPERLA